MASSPVIPTATYRFQFHKGFTFQDAQRLTPYLEALGVSHIYASPFFRAAPGSTHGYDVFDHNELNPEVGSREDLHALAADLHTRGLALLVDFVPNHMGIAEARNRWWRDVLENGPGSPYARFFDIDWQPLKRELDSKVLLPILGDQYGRVLESGELHLHFAEGRFTLSYYETDLPLAPRSTRSILQHAAERLSAPPAELESILTALEHLPARTDTAAEKITERTREKEIIRQRLLRLCDESPEVCEAITGAVADYNARDAAAYDRLDALISNQVYRLSSWKVAAEEINYRRFFDVNSLAAIRVELPEVFEAVHELLLQLIAAKIVSGVRIDHIDGLANPVEYLTQLQTRAAQALGEAEQPRAIYLLVEKILGAGEPLRAEWPVHGTTGYEFATQVTALLIDQTAEGAMTENYRRFIGPAPDFHEIVYESKLLVMHSSMASEVNVLGHLLNRVSESHRWYRDFTVNALTAAVREVIACFPVYRTYIAPGARADEVDRKVINRALAKARRRNPALERSVFEFLRDVLLPTEENAHPVDEKLRSEFVLKFQQCTGPITAKGVEDTAFYRFNRLVALNEVGGEPAVFGASIETFHRQNAARAAEFPHSLVATSTHDTKRSEDVRARLAALSELPQEWARAARRWRTMNQRHKPLIEGEPAPDANEEYLLYQTLVGSWPLAPMDDEARATYILRIQDYMMKALHEAKANTSWIDPNEAWDGAVRAFVAAILTPGRGNRFPSAFEPFAEEVARLGAINSLSQTVLKLTVPGVPDIYQGSELWDFSLVDPDNRRPVDYTERQRAVEALPEPANACDLLESWRDGAIKLYLTRTLLRFRREHAELFATGSYQPLETRGVHADSLVAFARATESHHVIVVAPRLSSRVGWPAIGAAWQDTTVTIEAPNGAWRNVLTGREHTGSLLVSELFAELPVAVLVERHP